MCTPVSRESLPTGCLSAGDRVRLLLLSRAVLCSLAGGRAAHALLRQQQLGNGARGQAESAPSTTILTLNLFSWNMASASSRETTTRSYGAFSFTSCISWRV